MGIILRFVFVPETLTEMILFDSDEPNGYSHVEAVTPDGKYLGAHTTGVEARPMDYDAGKFTRQKFFLLPADPEMSAKFYHYLRAVIGEKYDYAAIFGFVTHFDINQKHTVICSGLQTLAARACLFFPAVLPVPAHRVSVRDLELGLTMRPDVREIEPSDPVFISHINAGL
jgi:hypothetical protein